MKAIIENGGIEEVGLSDISLKRYTISGNNVDKLIIFNCYINLINRAISTEDLRQEAAALEHTARFMMGIKNPFHSGFTEDGFGVYNSKDERIIFVECEPDLNLD